jgi:hypothetical protein
MSDDEALALADLGDKLILALSLIAVILYVCWRIS